jgi:acyl-CoA-binding protein
MLDRLDKEFRSVFDKMSSFKKTIAPDVMLRLYAFNKQASYGNNFSFNSELSVRSAFKFNAWMQLKGMSPAEAKREYIKLANTIINPKK